MSEQRYDMLVAGGGLVGSTLAITCANAGLKVAMIDAEAQEIRSDSNYDGRASAISHGSIQVFKSMGLWDEIRKDASPIHDIRVADGDLVTGISPLFVHYDHRDIGDEPFGYIIENRIMRNGLHKMAEAAQNLDIFAPDRVETVETTPGMAQMTLSSGQSLMGSLACICDGRMSPLRKQLGISAQIKPYNQTAIVCTVRHEHAHEGVAVELFLPTGPFAMLPMTENRSNIVWTEEATSAKAFMEMDDAAFLDALKLRFGDWLGEIELTGPRFAYPLTLVLADHYTDHRIALVGDAAHGIHPIAGQGFNLGIRDIAALAETVVDARRLGLDIGQKANLAAYEHWRHVDSTILAHVCDGLLKLFSNDNPALRLARNSGLGVVNQLPPLKKFLMKHAMGMVGDLPRMVKGDTL